MRHACSDFDSKLPAAAMVVRLPADLRIAESSANEPRPLLEEQDTWRLRNALEQQMVRDQLFVAPAHRLMSPSTA